jgi:phenylacetate-CoA ligase
MTTSTGYVERPLWNEPVERMSRDALLALQLQRLKAQVIYNYDNSEFYRAKFDSVGMQPGDIHSFDDFARLPLMTKDEHRRGQAESLERYGNPLRIMNCAPIAKVVRINSTSGTTGMPTLYAVTARDVAVINEMHARKYWRSGIRPGHIMLQALSLSMFTGGLPLSQGIQHMGACVVPVGVEGGTKRVLDHIELLRPHAIIATPSFGMYLIEEAPKLVGKPAHALGLRWFFCAGEPGGGMPEVRKALAAGFGAKIFDHTGGGHAFHGISRDEPPEQYSGMYFVSEDHCLLEIVDPATKAPIPLEDEASGEMVFTFLQWEGGPFMRYALGDIIQVWTKPCESGLPGIRFKILGRSDDMLIVKGVNVYPQAIQNVIVTFQPRVTGHFRIRLPAPGPLVKPPLHLAIEHGAGMTPSELPALEREIVDRCRRDLRLAPHIEWLAPETLPRESKKVRLVEVLPSRGATG